MKDGEFIDVCTEWLGKRKAAYLAKEDKVVYYTSHTGRKADYCWMRMTLPEVVRTIQVTQLPPSEKLKKDHVIAALQEMDRVFEFGIKSRMPIQGNLFNYFTEAGEDMGDMVMSMLVDECFARGYMAMLYMDVMNLFRFTLGKLNTQVGKKEGITAMHKHWPAGGYEVRVDKYRPSIQGRKQSAIMMPGLKPRDVVRIPEEEARQIAIKIYGALR